MAEAATMVTSAPKAQATQRVTGEIKAQRRWSWRERIAVEFTCEIPRDSLEGKAGSEEMLFPGGI